MWEPSESSHPTDLPDHFTIYKHTVPYANHKSISWRWYYFERPPPRIKYVHFFLFIRFDFISPSNQLTSNWLLLSLTTLPNVVEQTTYFFFLATSASRLLLFFFFLSESSFYFVLVCLVFYFLFLWTQQVRCVLLSAKKIIAIIYNYGVFIVFPLIGLFRVCSCVWVCVYEIF